MASLIKWEAWIPLHRMIGEVLDNLNIISALILRNLRTQHANNPIGIFLELLRPAAICVAHYFYFTYTGRAVPGQQYATFTIGGFVIYFAFVAAFSGTFEAGKWPNGANLIPGVTRMHLRVARVVWSFVLHIGFAVAVVGPLLLLGQNISIPNIPLTIIDFSLAVLLGFGYGLVTNSFGIMAPPLLPFLKITQWAVFISSGIYDSLVTMPEILAKLVWYNPLIHLAEYQRHAYYSGYPIYLVTLTYPLVWAAGLILAGLTMNRALCNKKLQ